MMKRIVWKLLRYLGVATQNWLMARDIQFVCQNCEMPVLSRETASECFTNLISQNEVRMVITCNRCNTVVAEMMTMDHTAESYAEKSGVEKMSAT